jgi:hypothetical protein
MAPEARISRPQRIDLATFLQTVPFGADRHGVPERWLTELLEQRGERRLRWSLGIE